MRTKNLPFQLEQTVPGAFLIQGFTGGAVAGYLFLLFLILLEPHPYSIEAVFYLPFVMGVGGVLGLSTAIPLWAMYRLTGIRMVAPVRIVVSTVISTSLLSLLFYLVGELNLYVVRGAAISSLLLWLPAAVLTGSRVKPWCFFAWWSIAVQQHGFTTRLSSASVPAVVGVLPLRLLSTFGLGFWIFATAAIWPVVETDVRRGILFGLVPIAYFAVSLYLTFRSPGKFALLALGLLINLPITYLSYVGPHIGWNMYWTYNTSVVVVVLCTISLLAWTALVATRFLVNVNAFLPLSACLLRPFVALSPQHGPDRDHRRRYRRPDRRTRLSSISLRV